MLPLPLVRIVSETDDTACEELVRELCAESEIVCESSEPVIDSEAEAESQSSSVPPEADTVGMGGLPPAPPA
jgi:hypothetical protein